MWLCLSKWCDWITRLTWALVLFKSFWNAWTSSHMTAFPNTRHPNDNMTVLLYFVGCKSFFMKENTAVDFPGCDNFNFLLLILCTSFPGNDDFILLNTQGRKWCYIRICFMQCSNFMQKLNLYLWMEKQLMTQSNHVIIGML